MITTEHGVPSKPPFGGDIMALFQPMAITARWMGGFILAVFKTEADRWRFLNTAKVQMFCGDKPFSPVPIEAHRMNLLGYSLSPTEGEETVLLDIFERYNPDSDKLGRCDRIMVTFNDTDAFVEVPVEFPPNLRPK